MKLDCAHADTCLPDYWGGHHLPHVQIPVYRGMALKDVKNQLLAELREGAVAGAGHDPDDEKWYAKARAAVRRLRPAKKGARKVFTDLDEPDYTLTGEPMGETVYAFFVFVPLD